MIERMNAAATREAAAAFGVARYRRALLSKMRGPRGLTMPATRDERRDRAFSALFGPLGRRSLLDRAGRA